MKPATCLKKNLQKPVNLKKKTGMTVKQRFLVPSYKCLGTPLTDPIALEVPEISLKLEESKEFKQQASLQDQKPNCPSVS